MRMLVFDMAGTVINEHNVVYKTLHAALKAGGYNVNLDTVLAHGAGKEKKQALVDIVKIITGGFTPEPVDKVFELFERMLDEAYETVEISLFEGVQELITQQKNKGRIIVFNTGYKRTVAEKILSRLNITIGNEIDLLITSSDVQRSRPFPDMIHHAMLLSGITNSRSVIKVGDSIIDIAEGRNADCGLVIGITTGAHTQEQLSLASPDFIIHNISELAYILENNAATYSAAT